MWGEEEEAKGQTSDTPPARYPHTGRPVFTLGRTLLVNRYALVVAVAHELAVATGAEVTGVAVELENLLGVEGAEGGPGFRVRTGEVRCEDKRAIKPGPVSTKAHQSLVMQTC